MDQENNKIKLSEYIQLCLEMTENPSDENAKKLDEYLGKIQVRPYLSMKDKILTLGDILFTIPKDYDAIGDAAHIEICKITKGLLKYAINIENDIEVIDMTFSVYDVILQYGLYDTIINFCEEDFLRLVKIIDNTFNFDNIYKLITAVQFFDTDSYNKWIENIKGLQTAFTPEVLEGLKGLERVGNTDVTSAINQIVQEMNLNQVQAEMKKAELLEKEEKEEK